MKKSKLLIIILIVILLSGFVIPLFMDDLTYCTKKYCNCTGNDEIECNSCSVYDPVYYTILLNIGKNCQAKEVIICQDNEQKNVRYDKNECNYVWNSLFTEINRGDGIVIFE